MGDWFDIAIARQAIVCVISILTTIGQARGAIRDRPDEAILEEVIQDDDQVAEKLVNAVLAHCLP